MMPVVLFQYKTAWKRTPILNRVFSFGIELGEVPVHLPASVTGQL